MDPSYASDISLVWRDLIVTITWIIAIIFIISGGQDLLYDIWAYLWRIFRRLRFAGRERLSLARLRAREQQAIAVMLPAWSEGAIIGQMIAGIIERIEYRNFTIFVGTYPNDPETQAAVDLIAETHPNVVKVVNTQPGPTNKADCLNVVYQAIKQQEEIRGQSFDIIVMHDAEDVVHPQSFLLYNYLIPRVDVVQLPILPLPVGHHKWVHWVYADEFAENHMKDVLVREKMGGFVPYAGVGTGFARRAFAIMESQSGGELFNEGSMTEDYSMSKKTRAAGLRSIFVNLVLKDDRSGPLTPLAHRPAFIANWSYFPMTLMRSIRQKTRWIIGISLQEWENTGWSGSPLVVENLVKDRKVFVNAATNVLGFVVFLYFIISELGERGVLPFQWLPLVHKGDALYTLIVVDTLIMFTRMFQRMVYVWMVYGFVAGILSILRLVLLANVISGFAAIRALVLFSLARQGKEKVRWDKTEHTEGLGDMRSLQRAAAAETHRARTTLEVAQILRMLRSRNPLTVIAALEGIPRELPEADCKEILRGIRAYAHGRDHNLRAVVARVSGFLRWPQLLSVVRELLFDPEWVVRANAAKAMLKFPDLDQVLMEVFRQPDRYAWEILIRAIDQDERAQRYLATRLHKPELARAREVIMRESYLFRQRYPDWLQENGETEAAGVPPPPSDRRPTPGPRPPRPRQVPSRP